MRPIELTLNGTRVRTTVEPHETLLGVLRQRLAATEVKSGCERGDCGACAVLLDGRAINSCLALAVQADGRAVTTVRGLGTPEAPHPLQTAFIELGAAQCGICIPGMLVTLYAVLAAAPRRQPPGDPRGDRRQPLPLHRLPQDRRRRRAPPRARPAATSAAGREPRRERRRGAPRDAPAPAFRIVGQRAPRPDAPDKVFGLTRYADDFAMGGMLHAKVVRAPRPSARIVRIDTTRGRGRARGARAC